MDGVIEALHIYDEHNNAILSHTYTGRPLSASHLLPLYLDQAQQVSSVAALLPSVSLPVSSSSSSSGTRDPPPALVYLPSTAPATLVFGITHGNLLLLLTTASEVEPLLALEFLHRVADALEEFLGSPLLAAKIEAGYDVAAQLLTEMCDAGTVATTEGNALRDLVEVEGFVGKLLGSITLPGKAAAALSAATTVSSPPLPLSLSSSSPASYPALPWRRANVRHTSNELYADVVESLSVTLAPSGRPLAALAHGTIAFTAKVSGVPDILLTLAVGQAGNSSSSRYSSVSNTLSLPVFHPCVRLARWRERPGELSFVPPDGRFVLAAYEADLMPGGLQATTTGNSLRLPVNVEVCTGLGSVGADFEVRVHVQRTFSLQGASSAGSGMGSSRHAGTPASPLLQDVKVSVPLPTEVRSLVELRPTKGDAAYNPGDRFLEWNIPSKDIAAGTSYFSLRCTVVGHGESEDEDDNDAENNEHDDDFGFRAYTYDEPYQARPSKVAKEMETAVQGGESAAAAASIERKKDRNKLLMPASTSVSFSVKGWLASGVRVDSILLDNKRSRGLGEGVKPFKGVKYLTVSKGGVELRCGGQR